VFSIKNATFFYVCRPRYFVDTLTDIDRVTATKSTTDHDGANNTVPVAGSWLFISFTNFLRTSLILQTFLWQSCKEKNLTFTSGSRWRHERWQSKDIRSWGDLVKKLFPEKNLSNKTN